MSEPSYAEKLLHEYKLFLFGIAAGLMVSLEISVFWSRFLESGSQFLNQTLISRNPQATSTSVTNSLFAVGVVVIGATVFGLGWLSRRLLGIRDWRQVYSIVHKEDLNALSVRIIGLLEDFRKGTDLAPALREHEKDQDVIYLASASGGSLTRLVVTKDTVAFSAWRSERGFTLTGCIFQLLNTNLSKVTGAKSTVRRRSPKDHRE
jgi:hypothetical protein